MNKTKIWKRLLLSCYYPTATGSAYLQATATPTVTNKNVFYVQGLVSLATKAFTKTEYPMRRILLKNTTEQYCRTIL